MPLRVFRERFESLGLQPEPDGLDTGGGQWDTNGATDKDNLMDFQTKSLAEQLATLLSVEGVEDEIERSLAKVKVRIPGVWKNIFDGKICHELPTAEGSRFFFPSDEEVAAGELRTGVTMGVDWSVPATLP
ncbi:hypothetical protein B0H14DRAFT_3523914 [Mycena olivaceomarginata]|nr:hypothetical protein B0H14DRAFT_3523914 [Mycena olivaceomarginata]